MSQNKLKQNQQKSPRNHCKSLPNRLILLPFFTFIILFLLPGCERVIDVDLNNANPQIVIEGNLSSNTASLEVKISQTGSYFGKEPVETVKNATVGLTGGETARIEATHVENGFYSVGKYPLTNETEYTLEVELDGVKYTAKSTLNKPVKIDSLSYEYQQDMRFFEGGYRILLYFSDPADEDNFYRLNVYKNGKLFNESDDLIVFDDSGLNGKGIQVRLRGQRFDLGDTAKVEMLSIDEKAWLYFTTLREMANTNPGSPAPSNPVSNFNNGALGYFSAWSGDEKEIVIER